MSQKQNNDLQLFQRHNFKNLVKSNKPDSLFIFFLNFCSITCFVPFNVKWNAAYSYFKLESRIIQRFSCAILHTIICFYNIFICINTFIKINNLSRSYISASFDFVNNIISALSWINFVRITWFEQNKIEKIVNFTTAKVVIVKLKILKLCIVLVGLLYMYFHFEVVTLITQRMAAKHEFPSNWYNMLSNFFKSSILAGDLILKMVHTYLLLFYFVCPALLFSLSVTMLLRSCEIWNKLYFSNIHEIDTVRQKYTQNYSLNDKL